MQGSTHSVPTSPLHQKLKSCQSPPRLQEASLAAAPPSSPPPPPWSQQTVWNALPPPWPRKGSREGSGVGSDAVSWWGRGGLSQALLPSGPLPSFPGSSLGPSGLTFLGWLWSPLAGSRLTRTHPAPALSYIHPSPTLARQTARESGPWPFLRDQAPKAPSSSAWTSTVALGLVFGCGLHPRNSD